MGVSHSVSVSGLVMLANDITQLKSVLSATEYAKISLANSIERQRDKKCK